MASRTTPRAAPERLGRVVARSSASRGALSTRARGSARPRARAATLRVSAIGKLFGGIGSDDDSESNVFAAKKRSAVRIPGLVVDVTPAEVSDENAMRALEEVVRRGATAVILSDASGVILERRAGDADRDGVAGDEKRRPTHEDEYVKRRDDKFAIVSRPSPELEEINNARVRLVSRRIALLVMLVFMIRRRQRSQTQSRP